MTLVAIIGEVVGDEAVDVAELTLASGRALNGHDDDGDVGQRRLIAVRLTKGSCQPKSINISVTWDFRFPRRRLYRSDVTAFHFYGKCEEISLTEMPKFYRLRYTVLTPIKSYTKITNQRRKKQTRHVTSPTFSTLS